MRQRCGIAFKTGEDDNGEALEMTDETSVVAYPNPFSRDLTSSIRGYRWLQSIQAF
jgi:hypothetical protein